MNWQNGINGGLRLHFFLAFVILSCMFGLIGHRVYSAGQYRHNLMDNTDCKGGIPMSAVFAAFVQYLVTFIVLVAVAAAGIICGGKLRDRKSREEASEETSKQ